MRFYCCVITKRRKSAELHFRMETKVETKHARLTPQWRETREKISLLHRINNRVNTLCTNLSLPTTKYIAPL